MEINEEKKRRVIEIQERKPRKGEKIKQIIKNRKRIGKG